MNAKIRTFTGSIIITITSIAIAYYYGGFQATRIVLILAILEISLSFDNAVINARILRNFNKFWQKIFLTVGILIAVVGIRIILPLLIVSITTKLSPKAALELAFERKPLSDPTSYAAKIAESHEVIAIFGGMFLLMVFLDYFFNSNANYWLKWIEKPFKALGKLPQISVIFALTILSIIYFTIGEKGGSVLSAGIIGLLIFLLISGLGKLTENNISSLEEPQKNQTILLVGKSAFFMFLYLEILDASFSFDGVIGAFAITSDPVLIMLGLGLIGAIFVRSLTIYLVRNDTLSKFIYLENGAHWAIGVLALLLILSLYTPVNELIPGLSGLFFILLSIISSIRKQKQVKKA